MIDKIIGAKSVQSLDQSLISIGGWLRDVDAQIMSLIRSENNRWNGQNISLRQYHWNPDIPAWTYPGRQISLNQGRYAKAEPWYKALHHSLAPWHTSRDWRNPFPSLWSDPASSHFNVSGTGALALEYVYTSPGHSRLRGLMASAYPLPKDSFLNAQLASGLSQFWSASYQFSTALAVLLPVAVHTAQSPEIFEFVTQAARSAVTPPVSRETTVAPIAKLNVAAAAAQSPAKKVQVSKPTGNIANIQSYVLPAKGDFTSGYGMRWGRVHRGIDIAGPVGTPIVAAAAGKVITAGWGDDGFGYKVEIKHPDGAVTLYAHSSKILTRVGAQVRRGQQIAEMGSSGYSTGSHVHFQIHPKGKEAVDPMFFFGRNKDLIAGNPDA